VVDHRPVFLERCQALQEGVHYSLRNDLRGIRVELFDEVFLQGVHSEEGCRLQLLGQTTPRACVHNLCFPANLRLNFSSSRSLLICPGSKPPTLYGNLFGQMST
jgi:hypothetical protein